MSVNKIHYNHDGKCKFKRCKFSTLHINRKYNDVRFIALNVYFSEILLIFSLQPTDQFPEIFVLIRELQLFVR